MIAHDSASPIFDSHMSPSSHSLRSPYLPLQALSCGDPAVDALVTLGKRFIDRGLPVLILGETGTGKEYFARALHGYSERRHAAMVAVNCASIPESLIESELFGYTKGAFSGALPGGMKGKVTQAHGGTLFLDEIGDMPVAHQTRLLRVISEKEVMPLGAAQAVPVDLQLICATHQDLLRQVEAGQFREDLYYRIAVGALRLPPLRERADLPGLITRMLAQEWPLVPPEQAMTDDALQVMLSYSWPGNVRQLHSVISYACAVADGHRVTRDDLPGELMRESRHVSSRTTPVAAIASDASMSSLSTLLPGASDGDILSRRITADACDNVAGESTGNLSRFSAVEAAAPLTMPAHASQPLPRGEAVDAFNAPLSGQRAQRERTDILHALNAERWNISAAARSLGMCRASLYRKLKALHIPHLRDYSTELMEAHIPPPPYRRLSVVR